MNPRSTDCHADALTTTRSCQYHCLSLTQFAIMIFRESARGNWDPREGQLPFQTKIGWGPTSLKRLLMLSSYLFRIGRIKNPFDSACGHLPSHFALSSYGLCAARSLATFSLRPLGLHGLLPYSHFSKGVE